MVTEPSGFLVKLKPPKRALRELSLIGEKSGLEGNSEGSIGATNSLLLDALATGAAEGKPSG